MCQQWPNSCNGAETLEGNTQSYPRQVGLTCGETKSVIDSFGVPYRTPGRPRTRVRLFGYSLLGNIRRLLESISYRRLSATV